MKLSADRRRALTSKAQSFTANLEEALPYLLSRGISREVAEMFHLGCVPVGQEFAGRLSIPYLTPAGVVQIKYRCTKEHDCKTTNCTKYLYEAGLGVHLYNAQILISSGDTVVLTEGELDAICIQSYVGYPAVAYPGVGTWGKQAHWPLCFEGVSEVVVLSDGDQPGREAAKRVCASLGSKARVVDLPDGLDANEFINLNGVGPLQERIAA